VARPWRDRASAERAGTVRRHHELDLTVPLESVSSTHPAHNGNGSTNHEPDVFLDVPTLIVDELKFELDDLRARVSLEAAVLDLLKLNIGADAQLGRVSLTIKRVEAQAQLRVHLDNVAEIVGRVMTTVDRNPQILEELLKSVGTTVESVGSGAGRALEQVGSGAERALGEIGRGTGAAVEGVGTGTGSVLAGLGGDEGQAAST
jgi:hypothetical protein